LKKWIVVSRQWSVVSGQQRCKGGSPQIRIAWHRLISVEQGDFFCERPAKSGESGEGAGFCRFCCGGSSRFWLLTSKSGSRRSHGSAEVLPHGQSPYQRHAASQGQSRLVKPFSMKKPPLPRRFGDDRRWGNGRMTRIKSKIMSKIKGLHNKTLRQNWERSRQTQPLTGS
jgi:hypothetical protein